MTRVEIDTAVRKIIVEHLRCPAADVTPAKPLEDLGADSLDKVEIMMACEEEFGLSISDEAAEKLVAMRDYCNVVEDLLDQ